MEFRQSETTCGPNQIVRLTATMLVYISMPVDSDMWISLSTLHKHSSAWLTVSCKIWGWNTDIRMTMRQFVFMKDSINLCSVDPTHSCVPRPNQPLPQYPHVWGVGHECVRVCLCVYLRLIATPAWSQCIYKLITAVEKLWPISRSNNSCYLHYKIQAIEPQTSFMYSCL